MLLYDSLNVTDCIALNGKMTDEFERKQSCPLRICLERLRKDIRNFSIASAPRELG
jgi:hypothetical protein